MCNKLKYYVIEHAGLCISFTLLYVSWTGTENEKKDEREKERERERSKVKVHSAYTCVREPSHWHLYCELYQITRFICVCCLTSRLALSKHLTHYYSWPNLLFYYLIHAAPNREDTPYSHMGSRCTTLWVGLREQ